MKKILLIVLTISLMGIELPNMTKGRVVSVNGDTVKVSKNILKGISGIVIHRYGKGLFAVTHTIIGLGGNLCSVKSYNMPIHDSIPSVKTEVQKGDSVIFGNFYHTVLVIAPNKNIYNQVVKSLKNSTIGTSRKFS